MSIDRGSVEPLSLTTDRGKWVQWTKRFLETVEMVGVSAASSTATGIVKGHGLG